MWNEEGAMNAVILVLVRSFSGYSYETAGQIEGFFNDPVQAHACASEIETVTHKEVEVCGSQITVLVL